MALLPDHYEALGVASDATADQIKKAWRAAAARFHPDAVEGHLAEQDWSDSKADAYKADAAEEFKTIRAAWAALGDEVERVMYDAARAAELAAIAARKREVEQQAREAKQRKATPRPAPRRRPSAPASASG